MTLIVAGKALTGRAQLSDLAAKALACVDGGLEWVQWAAGAMNRYVFDDESGLAAAVQQGLHGSPYALLRGVGLLASPVKLMTLGPDLDTLRQADAALQTPTGPDPALAAQLQIVLQRQRLVTTAALAGARGMLATLGVAGDPLFTDLDMDAQMALYGLLEVPGAAGNTPLTQTAAAFALDQARTPVEFCDYYAAFLGYIGRQNAQNAPASQQTQLATTALQALLPLLFPVLDCPTVQGLVPPAQVAAAVQDWQRQGRVVGFSRLSEAAANLMLYSSYTDGTTAQAQQTINDYMASWQNFLAANPPQSGLMLQDGATCLFRSEARGLQGEVMLGRSGTITTRLFRRAPVPAAIPPSADPANGAAPPSTPGQTAPTEGA